MPPPAAFCEDKREFAIWDAGEPIAMLADALASMQAQKDRTAMEAWKSQVADTAPR